MPFLSQERAIKLLQYSLGITFLWFGVLKLFNASPVLVVIKHAMPPMLAESQWFLFTLSLLEIVIGIGLMANKFVKFIAFVMLGHLLIATGSVLYTQGFEPRFPILSFPGEFVMKNLVLMAAGFVLLTQHSTPKKVEEKKE